MKKWIDQVETIFFLRAWLYFSPSLRWRCGTKLSKRRRWNGFFHLEKKNRELKKGLQVEDGEDQSMNPREMKQNVIQSIQLIKSIHNRLEKNSLLQANTPVLLALSGGQDSMTMVSFFLQIKNQRRYKVGWCWCNHLWRYDVFSYDASFDASCVYDGRADLVSHRTNHRDAYRRGGTILGKERRATLSYLCHHSTFL